MTDETMPDEIYIAKESGEDGFAVECFVEKHDRGAAKYIRADLVPQWQPIETAPRDGTFILVNGVQDHYSHAGMCVAHWAYDSWVLGGSCGCNDNRIEPTHWMPLPQPPKKGNDDDKVP